ncbi:surface lipoprotein assembly modifier [Vibrio tapetis subsp. quintayensis]|uniref:surface lipoprotein assembly modifier n=1 Tax=Vibrio tapetis TaxID=52443 RepID=UPI0025B4704D|nr:surface lipoprotein assembly modifier [Vibrio tapetis]MDN3681206.1 surface lipoprotein assembly modifier [Vibrio tapetis subsp. quintayensis]
MNLIPPSKSSVLVCLLFGFSFYSLADQDTKIQIQQRDELTARETEQALLAEETKKEQQKNEQASSIIIDGETYQVNDTVPELGQALYLSVQSRQWALVSQFLTRYESLEGFDPLLVHYAKAALYRIKGELSRAEHEYSQLLTLQPDFLPAQLELARVQFENQKNADAYELFSVIDQNLPSDNPRSQGIRNTVNSFMTAAKNRDAWKGSFSFGPSYNDNLNQSSESYTCLARLPSGQCRVERSTPDAVKGSGFDFNASLNKRTSLVGHHGIAFTGLAYGSSYLNDDKFNEQTLLTSLGYSYQNARDKFTLSPQLEYSASGNKALYLASGLKFDWFKSLTSSSAMKLELEAEYQDYRPAHLDYQSDWQWSSYFSYWHQLPNKWLLFGGLDWTQKDNDQKVHAYQLLGGRLGVNRAWGDAVDVNLFTSFRQRKYGDFSSLLNERRTDNEQSYTLMLSSKALSFYGVTPLLTWTHKRVTSNVDWLYTYQQNEVSLKLEKRF